MKSKWKYGKALPIWLLMLLLIASCNRNEHRHIADSTNLRLDDVLLPVNRSVMSNIRVTLPVMRTIVPRIIASGIISYDPRQSNTISARVSGRIQKLYVRFNFQPVSAGEKLMDIYSPELISAQGEFIMLLNQPGSSENIKAVRNKLLLLGMTEKELEQLESTHRPLESIPFYSAFSGHIHDLGIKQVEQVSAESAGGMGEMNQDGQTNITESINSTSSRTAELTMKEGMYFNEGQPLFAVYSTSRLWILLDIFPADAALVQNGSPVEIISETHPDAPLNARIDYIEPTTDKNASTVKARVYLDNNKEYDLRIGTLVKANISAIGISGMWLPRTAVLETGHGKAVFLRKGNTFTARSIRTGVITDSQIQVLDGISMQDSIAENAQFLVDSESFIQTQ